MRRFTPVLLFSLFSATMVQAQQPDVVDLGLPSGTLWGTCNVGATRPEEVGEYFAWGETEPKRKYDGKSYKYFKNTLIKPRGFNFGEKRDAWKEVTKYSVQSSTLQQNQGYKGFLDNKTVLESLDDAAHMSLGSGWRTPTAQEFGELVENCSQEWVLVDGVSCLKLTSKVPGYGDRYILLPTSGYKYDSKDSQWHWKESEHSVYLWSASLDTQRYSSNANYFHCDDVKQRLPDGMTHREIGMPVRPVFDPHNLN